jgi:hypothetical protein
LWPGILRHPYDLGQKFPRLLAFPVNPPQIASSAADISLLILRKGLDLTPSTFIARILGPVLVVAALGLLLQTESLRATANEFLKSPALIYFSGVTSLAIGLAVLNVHHLWVRDWRVIITIFGWLALVSGIFRILATTFVQSAGLEMMTHPRGLIVGAVADLVLGGYLSIMGYRDIWDETARAKPHRAAAVRTEAKGPAKAKVSSTAKRTGRRPKSS